MTCERRPLSAPAAERLHRPLTVLLRPDGDGRRGGALAALGLGRQPDVVQRVRVETLQDVFRGHGQAPVVLELQGQRSRNDKDWDGWRRGHSRRW